MKSLILAVALLLSSQANAGIHPLHYIKTHKSLLASDAVILGSSLAESYTSVACTDAMWKEQKLGFQEAITSNCSKQRWQGLEIGIGIIAADHVGYHFRPDNDFATRNFFWLVTAPLAVTNIHFTLVNIPQTNYLLAHGNPYPSALAIARARVSQ